jgi:hypothetical protein
MRFAPERHDAAFAARERINRYLVRKRDLPFTAHQTLCRQVAAHQEAVR